MTILSFTYL